MRWAEGDRGAKGLEAMCDYGAKMAAEKGYIPKFECFNLEEVEHVTKYMIEQHPEVEFLTTNMVFK